MLRHHLHHTKIVGALQPIARLQQLVPHVARDLGKRAVDVDPEPVRVGPRQQVPCTHAQVQRLLAPRFRLQHLPRVPVQPRPQPRHRSRLVILAFLQRRDGGQHGHLVLARQHLRGLLSLRVVAVCVLRGLRGGGEGAFEGVAALETSRG